MTLIDSELQQDPPLVMDTNYRFDFTDRRYIDQQIRALEKHLVDSLIVGRITSWYDLDGSSSNVIAGDTVCLASTYAGTVTKSTAAKLALCLAPTGVVVQAANAGGKVLVAVGGILPSSTTGLSDLAPGFVIVNQTTSRLQRKASLDPGDVFIGNVDNAGWLQIAPANAPGAGGGGGGGGAGVVPSIIFRPGVASATNHVATWAEVAAFIATTTGFTDVFIDDSLGAAIVPNTANTTLQDRVTLRGFGGFETVLTIANGGRLRYMAGAEDLVIRGAPTATIPLVFGTNPVIKFERGGLYNMAGALVAMVTHEAGGFDLTFDRLSTLNNAAASSTPLFLIPAAASLLFRVTDLTGLVTTDAPPYIANGFTAGLIQGDGTTTLEIEHDATMLPTVQTLFLGTFSASSNALAQALRPSRGTSAQRPTGAFAPQIGQTYFDTTLDALITWNGSTWVSGGGTPAGATGEVQYNNAGVFGGATNVKAGSNYLSFGAAPAGYGNVRLTAGDPGVYFWSGGANIQVFSVTAGNTIQIGTTGGTLAPIVIGAGLNQVITLDATETIASNNFTIGGAPSILGGGGSVLGMHDGVSPSGPLASGIVFFSQGGVGKILQADGTIVTIGGIRPPDVIALLDIDWSLADVFYKTLAAGANVMTFSNDTNGQLIIVEVTGAASTLTWPTVLWPGGAAPVQTASGTDIYTFIKRGSNIFGTIAQAMA